MIRWRGHEEASSTMINQEALSSKINPGEVLMFSLRGHGRALIVMLSLGKIKDVTGQCSVNWSLFYRFYSLWLINMYALDDVDECFFRQVSSQCPKHQVWVEIVCQHRHYRDTRIL